MDVPDSDNEMPCFDILGEAGPPAGGHASLLQQQGQVQQQQQQQELGDLAGPSSHWPRAELEEGKTRGAAQEGSILGRERCLAPAAVEQRQPPPQQQQQQPEEDRWDSPVRAQPGPTGPAADKAPAEGDGDAQPTTTRSRPTTGRRRLQLKRLFGDEDSGQQQQEQQQGQHEAAAGGRAQLGSRQAAAAAAESLPAAARMGQAGSDSESDPDLRWSKRQPAAATAPLGAAANAAFAVRGLRRLRRAGEGSMKQQRQVAGEPGLQQRSPQPQAQQQQPQAEPMQSPAHPRSVQRGRLSLTASRPAAVDGTSTALADPAGPGAAKRSTNPFVRPAATANITVREGPCMAGGRGTLCVLLHLSTPCHHKACMTVSLLRGVVRAKPARNTAADCPSSVLALIFVWLVWLCVQRVMLAPNWPAGGAAAGGVTTDMMASLFDSTAQLAPPRQQQQPQPTGEQRLGGVKQGSRYHNKIVQQQQQQRETVPRRPCLGSDSDDDFEPAPSHRAGSAGKQQQQQRPTCQAGMQRSPQQQRQQWQQGALLQQQPQQQWQQQQRPQGEGPKVISLLSQGDGRADGGPQHGSGQGGTGPPAAAAAGPGGGGSSRGGAGQPGVVMFWQAPEEEEEHGGEGLGWQEEGHWGQQQWQQERQQEPWAGPGGWGPPGREDDPAGPSTRQEWGATGALLGGARDGSQGGDAQPWWHRFPDFVPVDGLAGGRNPRWAPGPLVGQGLLGGEGDWPHVVAAV